MKSFSVCHVAGWRQLESCNGFGGSFFKQTETLIAITKCQSCSRGANCESNSPDLIADSRLVHKPLFHPIFSLWTVLPAHTSLYKEGEQKFGWFMTLQMCDRGSDYNIILHNSWCLVLDLIPLPFGSASVSNPAPLEDVQDNVRRCQRRGPRVQSM